MNYNLIAGIAIVALIILIVIASRWGRAGNACKCNKGDHNGRRRSCGCSGDAYRPPRLNRSYNAPMDDGDFRSVTASSNRAYADGDERVTKGSPPIDCGAEVDHHSIRPDIIMAPALETRNVPEVVPEGVAK